jgi:hypothetical protein
MNEETIASGFVEWVACFQRACLTFFQINLFDNISRTIDDIFNLSDGVVLFEVLNDM